MLSIGYQPFPGVQNFYGPKFMFRDRDCIFNVLYEEHVICDLNFKNIVTFVNL